MPQSSRLAEAAWHQRSPPRKHHGERRGQAQEVDSQKLTPQIGETDVEQEN